MIPSIDARLDSIVRALRDVIAPALPPDRSLAIEQAHLALAQIGLIRQQLDDAPRFERDEAQAMLDLARDLLAAVDRGPATHAAAVTLAAAVEAASLDSPASVRRATAEVGQAIEGLIEASLEDGGEAFRKASMRHVLAAGRTAALANRRWNKDSGFEAQDDALS